jgi:hypothetical protein
MKSDYPNMLWTGSTVGGHRASRRCWVGDVPNARLHYPPAILFDRRKFAGCWRDL